MSNWMEMIKTITMAVGAVYICVKLWVLVRDKTTISSTVATFSTVIRRNSLPFLVCVSGGAGLLWASTWALSPASVFVSVLCGALIAISFSAALLMEVALCLSRPAEAER